MRTLVAAGLFHSDAEAQSECMLRPKLLMSRQLRWYVERKAAVLEAGGSMDDVLAACCHGLVTSNCISVSCSCGSCQGVLLQTTALTRGQLLCHVACPHATMCVLPASWQRLKHQFSSIRHVLHDRTAASHTLRCLQQALLRCFTAFTPDQRDKLAVEVWSKRRQGCRALLQGSHGHSRGAGRATRLCAARRCSRPAGLGQACPRT